MQGTWAWERRPHLLTAAAALAALAAGLLLLVLTRSEAPELMLPFSGPEGHGQAERAYGELPLAFERDAGRSGPEVDFLARTPAGMTAIGPEGATLALGEGKRTEALGLELGDSAAAVTPQALERLPGEVNYLVGERSEWKTDIATFERVRYADVYPGISLDWYGDQRRLEYDFRLAPGAGPSRIALNITGAQRVHLAPSGDLVIDTAHASVRQRAPVAYQTIAGRRVEIESSFALRGHTVGFELGAYDRSRPLIIDPLVLAYSTYLGGDGADDGIDVAVDAAGAAYVTGTTASTDFNTVGQIEGNAAGEDVFVSKLTPAGSALAYSTYLGGSLIDRGGAIAVDGTGAAYITGFTQSTDFNTIGQIEGDSAGTDAFVSKLTPAGSGLAYSTYLGGGASDQGIAIAVDATGAAYLTGITGSTDFDTVGPIEGDSVGDDAFVSKLTPAGSALAYSTYLGGDGSDFGLGIAVDAAGAAHLTGFTSSSDFNTVGQIEGDSAGSDAFVSKLTPAGSALTYSTYLGGDAEDQGNAIALGGDGAAYVTGFTDSTDFNTVGQIEGDSAGFDAFVSKLTPAGSVLAYSTYLGGDADDYGNAIAVDPAGAAYVAGQTGSSDFNTVGPIEGNSTGDDAFVSKLTPAGSALAYSTYLGGNASDVGIAIAVDAAGAAYVTGQTASTDFNMVGPIEGNSASTDVFVSKLSFDADADGIPDDADACPTEAGPASNGGCPLPPPDSDADGVPDPSDACPTEAGPSSNNGCPLPPPDADADGVPDPSDACPTEAGPAANNGCPLGTPPVTKANRTISLETSKSKVTKGKKVRLSGQIAAATDEAACEAGQAVELQRVKTGSAFKAFATDTTDAAGKYSLKVRVRKTFRYRAALTETAACEDAISNVKKVKAIPPR